MQESEIDNLLNKYIRQQCSQEELLWVLNYIELPEGKLKLETLLAADWNAFEAQQVSATEAEKWLERFEARTNEQKKVFTSVPYSWLKYAAMIFLVLGVATWFIVQRDRPAAQIAMEEQYNPKGKRTKITLPDGSVVHLGADSRLRYPEQLNANSREVSLEGEAFFEVSHDENRPFIVHTGEVQTQVLGTSFKIEAFKNHQLSVAVATGRVSVDYKEPNRPLKSLAVLTPGRKVSWNPIDHQSVTTTLAIEDVSAWKDGTLAFADVRLDDIAAELERWYNIKLIIKDAEVNAYSLSISVNGNAPINAALDAITGATGLTYKIAQNQITISMNK